MAAGQNYSNLTYKTRLSVPRYDICGKIQVKE